MFQKNDLVKTRISLYSKIMIWLITGLWCPRVVIINAYREDLVAWECWSNNQQWFFIEEKLEKIL